MPENARPLASKLFLLKEMVARDVRARYAGSGLGVLWAFAMPILWMLLYTGVFGLVLKVPVDPGYASFPEFLMAGLLPWMAISEGISRASSCLIDNAPMVKKTVFPLETLVLSVVLAAMVNEIIALAVYGVYVALLGHLSAAWPERSPGSSSRAGWRLSRAGRFSRGRARTSPTCCEKDRE